MTLRTVHTKAEKTNSIFPSNPKPFPPPIKKSLQFFIWYSAHRGEQTFRLFSLTGFIKESKKVFLWSGIRWTFTGCQNFRFSAKCRAFCFLDKKSVWWFYYDFKKLDNLGHKYYFQFTITSYAQDIEKKRSA